MSECMKLIFLGTGSAFTIGDGNYQSNLLLESDTGKRLLIDCGSDARHGLYEQGFTYKDIHDVYISHLHADHVGGLEWLALTTKYDPECHQVCLHLGEPLISMLWNGVLSGGLNPCGENIDLLDFFAVESIPPNGKFVWENIQFQIVPTFHIACKERAMPSYGLFIRSSSKAIFITTDTQLSLRQHQEWYHQADIIFQDCETSDKKSGVHAHYSELIALDSKIKQKMWLYHYQPGPLPDAKADGFCGFVKKGQSFYF